MVTTSLEGMAARLASRRYAEYASEDAGPWVTAEAVKKELDGALEDLSTLGLAAVYGLIQEQAYTDMSNRVSKAAASCRRDVVAIRHEMDRILSSVAAELLRKKREDRGGTSCCG